MDSISKNESELLTTAIDRILSADYSEEKLSDYIPTEVELSDSNHVVTGKASVLFVDIRDSSRLPECYSSEQLVKLYRSYTRTVVQAIRYSGGWVKDFMGDGVLAVFIDSKDEKSEDRAVYAARYITTAIDKFLNPRLDRQLKYRISCGIGICSGNISISKVGMKRNDREESEYGISWVGNCTNKACKYSGLIGGGSIFIDAVTHAEITATDKNERWTRTTYQKNGKIYEGYLAEHYYLNIDGDIEPCVADSKRAETFETIYVAQLDELENKAKDLGRWEQELKGKETNLSKRENQIQTRESQLRNREIDLLENEFSYQCKTISDAHCEKEYAKKMGSYFFERHLAEAIELGHQLGKSEQEVKQKLAYALVSIYEALGQYDKAYDYVVYQAEEESWLHLSTVQGIVNQVHYCNRLKEAIDRRLRKNDLSEKYRVEFKRMQEWLGNQQ